MTKGIQTGEPVAVHQHFTIPGSTIIGTLEKLRKFNVMVNIKHTQIYFIHNTQAGVHNGQRKVCGGEVLPYMEKILNNVFTLAFFDLKLGLLNSIYTISIYEVLFF